MVSMVFIKVLWSLLVLTLVHVGGAVTLARHYLTEFLFILCHFWELDVLKIVVFT